MNAAEFYTMLDSRFDDGGHYPTLDDYSRAFAELRAKEAQEDWFDMQMRAAAQQYALLQNQSQADMNARMAGQQLGASTQTMDGLLRQLGMMR